MEYGSVCCGIWMYMCVCGWVGVSRDVWVCACVCVYVWYDYYQLAICNVMINVLVLGNW